MKKIKRGRGRPTSEMQQFYAMEDARRQAKELFSTSYPDAMKYIASLVNDASAPKNLRLSAAKVVKEQVEAWLEEHYAELEPEEDSQEDEIPGQIVI